MEVEISEGEYNGRPVINIENVDSDRYPFSFGLSKARLLLQALEQEPDFIKEFVQKYTK